MKMGSEMAKGRIHVLSKIRNEPWGGGNQFLKALIAELKSMNAYEEDAWKADAILFNSYPFGAEELFKKAADLKKAGKAIIQRVAGPFIVVRGSDAGVDEVISRFNRGFVNGTIFQSAWSKDQWNKVGIGLGEGPGARQITVLNAPDKTVFHSRREGTEPSTKIRIISSSWSANPRKGFHLLKHLDDNLDFNRFSFTFVGNSPLSFKNILHQKPMESGDLAAALRAHDIYFSGSMNDSCPNALIEAMHCGLPAVALRSGGQPEIVGLGGELFDGIEDVVRMVEKVGADVEGYRKRIDLPDIGKVAREYLEFCLSMERLPVPRTAGKAMITLRYLNVMKSVAKWKVGSRIRRRIKGLARS